MCYLLITFCVVLLFLAYNFKPLLGKLHRWKKDLKILRFYISVFYNGATKYRQSVCDNFEKILLAHPQKVLFYFEDEIWTSSKVKETADKISLYFQNKGYQKGDAIALMYDNCPEYVCLWLGLAQIGVVTALVNTNIVKDALAHSIKVAKCKAIICGSNYAAAVSGVAENLSGVKVYELAVKGVDTILPHHTDMRKELKDVDPYAFERKLKLHGTDLLLYIFTSGTTGLPKAALLSHIRYNLLTSTAMAFPPNSVIYCPLPLYHASGTVLGVGQALVWGNTIVLKKRFSASNYWDDCIKYRANVGQYIGEMCRYVLSSPGDKKIKHPVKIMFGNGLKPQIWKQFVARFGVEQIFEVYGSTEGNAGLVNLNNTVGSVGCIPPLLKLIYPLAIVKFNEDTYEPLRNKEGRCVESGPREPGILITKISNRVALSDFKGYANDEDTNKKILKDVFKIGDKYFNTGDVLEADENGDLYFLDRTGDTFRWKGENVSTCEVEAIISNLIHLNDAIVFGVEIPGVEGRAGMAAIVSDNLELDTSHLLRGLKENLPSYAIPLFVRVMDSLPLTSTCKLQKVKLRTEGFNVKLVKDNIYFYHQREGKYVLLSKELHDQIIQDRTLHVDISFNKHNNHQIIGQYCRHESEKTKWLMKPTKYSSCSTGWKTFNLQPQIVP